MPVASRQPSPDSTVRITASCEPADTHRSRGPERQRFGALAPLAVVALSLPVAIPLFSGRSVSGHDDLEHLFRTAEYARALSSGVWWPQWAPNLGRGYGEPIFVFNPPLFYALTSAIVLLGGSIVWAVNLTCAFLLIAGGLGVYAWTAWAFGSLGGVVAAAAYVWAPYVLLDLYVRQALTELTAVCVVPWALWGLAGVCRDPGPRRLAAAALAVGLLLLASTPAAVVTAPALLGQIIALGHWRRPRGAACGLAALALGTLLAAAFWVPALSERHLLRFDRLVSGGPLYANHFLEPWQLVSSAWGYGGSVPGPDDRMGFGLGGIHLMLAACALAILVSRRFAGSSRCLSDTMRRQIWLAIVLVALGSTMAMEPSAYLWRQRPELQYLQFPWRFLLLPALGCAVLAAAPSALAARDRPNAAAALAVLSASLLVAGNWAHAKPEDLRNRPDEEFAAAVVAARDRGRDTSNEYETIWTERRPAVPPAARLVVKSGAASIVEQAADAHQQRFAVTASRRTRLLLNTFYFPGWRVLVGGEEQPVEYGNANGLIEFSVGRGEHIVEARFEPTAARWLGRALSVLGVGAVILLAVWPCRREPSQHPRRGHWWY